MTSSDVTRLFKIVENGSPCEVSEFLKEASLNPELSLRSFVNLRNEQNRNALHVASSKLLADITQILLEAGTDPNAQDVDGVTPVFLLVVRLEECNCEDCMRKAVRCLTVLSFHGACLDIPDGSGITLLYLSAEHHFLEFTKALLENGAALGTVKGQPLVEVLAEKIPGVMEIVFDRAVKVTKNKAVHDPDYELTFDLGVIMPAHITLSQQLRHSNGNMNQVYPAESWFSENYEPSEEMTFLKQLLEHTGEDSETYRGLLKHPLVNVFTDIKWKSLEVLYMLFLLMQIKVLVAYSAFIIVTIFIDCPYDLYLALQSGLQTGLSTINTHGNTHIQEFLGSDRLNASEIIDPAHLCEINIISKVLSIFVIFCTTCVLVKEVQHVMYDPKEYLRDIFNYFQLVGFIAVLFTVTIAWSKYSPLYSLLYPAAAFGIAVSWCQIFVQIGRLPRFAIYIEMFVKISVNFCFSLAIYSFVLVGFAMSYSILFPEKPRLLDLPLSMVKVLTMLVGELDYEDMFNDKEARETSGNEDRNGIPKSTLHHRFASRVWYVNFVVFVTLVLMNLLVGLAVSDIQGIQKESEIYVIRRRIRYIAYLEKSLFNATGLIPHFMRRYFRESICVAKPERAKGLFSSCFKSLFLPIQLKRCKLPICPNKLMSSGFLSEESKTSIRQWISTKSATNVAKQCRSNRGSFSSTGFRQKSLANYRKGSQISLIGQHQLFVKEDSPATDSERLNRLEFNVQQMYNKMNELDLKLDTILKGIAKLD